MPSFTQFLLFLGPTLLLNLTPGPDMLFILGCGLARGRAGALRAVAGTSLGYLFHVALVTLGVAGLVARAPALLLALKLGGAAYLAVIGCKSLFFASRGPRKASTTASASCLRQGMVVSASNPKVVVFFLAYLPQFVDGARGDPHLQLAAFGLTFIASSALVNGSVALLSGTIGRDLANRPGRLALVEKTSGALMLGLAARLAA